MDSKIVLTDEQWNLIKPFFPQKIRSSLGGRPEVDNRRCLEGILWVLTTGARWKDLPAEYPSYCSCWRRFRNWTESGAFLKAWSVLLEKLDELGQLDLSTLIGDGTFCASKKKAMKSA
ncbi:transposase [Rubinisphaera margarita]|uniref:transposase n=1 Tax=Rubinisphaera margarita TaxID=2909586 RepID=UPI001EE81657|nr:transposase [Rubinisphaera margarita]MCG6158346.1 transposase [Rubinisphaera margarita]